MYISTASAASSSSLLILEHPSSLLVPVNKTAVFTARAFCMNQCYSVWSVNQSYNFDTNEFVPFSGLWNGDELSVTLSVNVSESINNTKVCCEFDEPGIDGGRLSSETATLIVISGTIILN